MKDTFNIAVIFAGGVGTRMRSKDVPKQFLVIHGKPIIIHTLEHFQNCDDIDAIVISCVSEYTKEMQKLADDYKITKVKKIVKGGATGQESIYNGLVAAKSIAKNKAIVLIHDGVRPLITEQLISENISCVREHGSCITVGNVKETIVKIDKNGEIVDVPPRADSRVAKAPQSFYLDDILSAHENAREEGKNDYIDSCTLMRKYGYVLHTIDGPYENIKVTTPEDYFTMRAILDIRENNQLYVDEM